MVYWSVDGKSQLRLCLDGAEVDWAVRKQRKGGDNLNLFQFGLYHICCIICVSLWFLTYQPK